ncbi:restriction endonuclease subunit S [Paenibacillus cookii]|uniref:Specificity protein S n=1 Tax=Paenibacillus cookii TaxID=157839 RepID=A0ABQ4M3A6_9BACL|nr:restriction endonuclease subunit S [Paenibacillus cookii]GIO69986.1 specificity protein S [Paenibacillus cookii]
MSFELKKYKLAEIADVQTGPFGSQLHKDDYVPHGTPIITVEHLGENFIIHENTPKVSNDDALRLSKYSLCEGDIVFSRVGSVDRRAYVSKKEHGWLFSGRCLRVRVNKKDKIDPKYLSYYFGLESFREYVRSIAVGATMPSLNTKIMSSLEIQAPELNVQVAISKLLSSLDNKIELNNAINKNLEEMAQALFKRWFVDFEFPNENGEPYKSSGGEFEESELGLIPKGWKLDCLDEIADYLNGLAMQKYRPDGEQFIPVIKIRELNQGRTSSESDKASPNIDKKYIVNNGDVLFSWSGTLDIKLWCGGTGGLNQHLFKVTSKNYDKWFYYYWTKYHIDRFRRIASDKATTMGHIKRSDLKEAKVLIPEPNIYKKATDVFKPIVDKVIQLSVESLLLERVRDTLLPKLMSGEIRVPVEQDHNDPDLPKVAESSAIYQP